ncbi:hypothetical protein [Endozoicomonas sp. 8E]|uniref:hypothetical protein n=1 Tax=Endozoicomonas sp. 8E TaxID=3035692 RepID=UPI0029391EAC|nr:hypothetical protein [Endozoicomonas sp. 8E]WOG26919.1 hypothetical protein P6910_20575 [Endozoicomonas sp. 8E]
MNSGHDYSCVSHFKPLNARDTQQRSLIELWNNLTCIQPLFDSEQLSEATTYDVDDSPSKPADANCLLEEIGISITLNHSETQPKTTESCQLGQPQPYLSETDALQVPLASNDTTYNLTVVEENGQSRPCGAVCKNPKAPACYKSRYHNRRQTCSMIVDGQDGHQRP